MCDTEFPCDLLLLYSKTDNGACHIKTANLDGETNLKQKCLPNKFPHLNNESELFSLSGVVKCDKPNTQLYHFNGSLFIDQNQ